MKETRNPVPRHPSIYSTLVQEQGLNLDAKFNWACGALKNTNRTSTLLIIVVAVLIIGAAGAAVLLNPGSHSTVSSSTSSSQSTASQSTTNSSSAPFKIESMQLIVGYKGGLFSVGFQDVAGKPVESLVVILSTPTEAALCTGAGYGLQFANCVPGPDKTYVAGPSIASGNFAANATFTGFATGLGPGSATVGQNYTVTITADWVDKTTTVTTLSVQATSG